MNISKIILNIIITITIYFGFSFGNSNFYKPEYYSIISMRSYSVNETIPFSFWNEHIDVSYYNDLHEVKPKDKTWVFTFGYRKPFENINYQKEHIPFHNYFLVLNLKVLIGTNMMMIMHAQ